MAPFLLRLQELAPFWLYLSRIGTTRLAPLTPRQELAPGLRSTRDFYRSYPGWLFLWVSVTSQKHSELFTTSRERVGLVTLAIDLAKVVVGREEQRASVFTC